MIRHHPSPETLADYAGGGLADGMALIIACHVSACTVCRSEVGLWDSIGGAMLDATDAVALGANALAKTLARANAQNTAKLPELPNFLHQLSIPQPLTQRRIGARRWVTPNIWFAPVDGSPLTYLVFARRNTRLSFHTHGGREYTCVIDGAFDDVVGSFAVGDFAETNEAVEHAPTATAEGSCLCLISSETPMRLKYRPAQIIQSLFGMQY
ncbi:MAG TPA: ChrR family anti-sigma-E factor [Rhizomicrobium sp.]|nr:ChrR family anti-sigma-E factor [Rhizomicrobium sp.]